MPGELTALSAAGRFGNIGITERARALGGTVRLDSRSGAATSVVAQVPRSTATDAATARPGLVKR
ncbi:hypothetical protein [Phytohabitans kaempferiae]|uniref:Uncharacterized protein n=1 Tax=Phytohabitans kaempferiae TaxID=1620943 RepID=A0ABV6LXK2_9ACTN